MWTLILHTNQKKITCRNVNVLLPEAGDLFIIYKVSENVITQINIECIITKVQEILKPQRDR